MAEIDLQALKRDILRVIEAGANRGEVDRLEREVRVLFDRASAVPALIQAKEEALAQGRKDAFAGAVEFLEAGAKGAAENIHDAEQGKVVAAALLQQAALLRALCLSAPTPKDTPDASAEEKP